MHAAVYELRDDVNVIIHTHQPYASALALMERPIPALFDEQVRYLGRSVDARRRTRPSGTSFLKKNVAKTVGGGANAFILDNHGVLVLGGDRRARRAQHGAAREGRARLPAGADHRREGATRCRCRSARSPSASCARTRRSSRGRWRRRAPRARRPRSAPARRMRAAERRGGGRGEPARRRRRRARAAGRGCRRPAPAAGRPCRRPARRLRHQPLPGRRGRLREARRAGARSRSARSAATPWTEYLDYFDESCGRSKELTDAAGAHPRRRAAQPRLQLPVPARHRARPRAPTSGTSTATATSTSSRPAGPPCSAATTSRVREQGRRARRGVRPGDRALPRVRAQAGRAGQPPHAVGRDVPHARLRHRERDGRHPRRAHLHREEVGHQGRRRLPRLERPDGLRPARARAPGGFEAKGIPFGRHGAHAARSSPTTSTRCGRKLMENRRAGRHGGGHRRAGRARRAAPARCRSTSTPSVRELCDEFGALLIFDEVVTGFRLGPGRGAGLLRRASPTSPSSASASPAATRWPAASAAAAT